MTQASCEKRSDVLPGQGHARSDRPLKKTGLAKKGNAGVSAADRDPGLDAQKKNGTHAFAKKHLLRARDRLPVWQETRCGRSQPKRCFHSCPLSMDQADAVWLPKTACYSPVPLVPGEHRAECTLGCGQAAAYPQDAMCRTPFTGDQPFFFQHRCRLDTILVPRVLGTLNC